MTPWPPPTSEVARGSRQEQVSRGKGGTDARSDGAASWLRRKLVRGKPTSDYFENWTHGCGVTMGAGCPRPQPRMQRKRRFLRYTPNVTPMHHRDRSGHGSWRLHVISGSTAFVKPLVSAPKRSTMKCRWAIKGMSR